jgi:hypothetical protein
MNLEQFVIADPKPKGPQKAATRDNSVAAAIISVTAVPFVAVAAATTFTTSTLIADKPANLGANNPAVTPVLVPPPSVPNPELERAFADVKKFEFTVQPQTGKQPAAGLRQQSLQPQATEGKAELVKLPEITTDAITNVQQQQLPIRVIAVQKMNADPKAVEQSKPESATSPSDTTATTPTAQVSDLIRPVERVDQTPSAHHVEIPNIPRVPVVRTVSMEVGDAGSQVTIRIQERGGDITMQLHTGSDSLQQVLQSSVGSLAHALRQEEVQVSTIEVSRKSPIDRVRRMKEAQ